jgi:polysaccharide chain length determinant protein (PEP-CTERM system associated)
MAKQRETKFEDFKRLILRRKWAIVLPVLILPIVGYGVAKVLPKRFTSTALVIVEGQKVPEGYVRSVVTDELQERLIAMQEQILSRTRLQPVLEKFGVYKNDVGKVPMEELVEKMRKSIAVVPLQGSMSGPKNAGVPGFNITFTAENARLAQQVCTEITSMFMEENLKIREQRAEGTTGFLTKQLEEAKRSLDDLDSKLADFKRKYVGGLPQQEQMNFGLLTSLNVQLDAANQALNKAQHDRAYAKEMLSQQLANWRITHTTGTNTDSLAAQIASTQSQLNVLEGRYTPDHPDVVKMRADIEQLKKKMEIAKKASPGELGPEEREPLDIQQMRASIRELEGVVQEKQAEVSRLRGQMGVYQARLAMTPVVEEQYKQLTRDYGIAFQNYNDLLAKKTQSEMATDLERKQQGEQFRLMDPANLPEKPTFPNTLGFCLGGLGLGFISAFGLVWMLENQNTTIYTEADIDHFLEVPVLGSVRMLERGVRKESKSTRRVLQFVQRRKAKAAGAGGTR